MRSTQERWGGAPNDPQFLAPATLYDPLFLTGGKREGRHTHLLALTMLPACLGDANRRV